MHSYLYSSPLPFNLSLDNLILDINFIHDKLILRKLQKKAKFFCILF